MAKQATLQGASITIGGSNFSVSKTVTGSKALAKEVTVAAAKTGTLSTRTDANTGTITGQASHGIATADVIDVYWLEGGVYGARRSMTVGTVSGNSIPIDGGSGDDLPSATTAVTLQKRTEVEFTVTGDNVLALACQCSRRGTFVIAGADDAEDYARVFESAGNGYIYVKDVADDNPVAGDTVTKVFVSNGDSSATNEMKIGVLET